MIAALCVSCAPEATPISPALALFLALMGGVLGPLAVAGFGFPSSAGAGTGAGADGGAAAAPPAAAPAAPIPHPDASDPTRAAQRQPVSTTHGRDGSTTTSYDDGSSIRVRRGDVDEVNAEGATRHVARDGTTTTTGRDGSYLVRGPDGRVVEARDAEGTVSTVDASGTRVETSATGETRTSVPGGPTISTGPTGTLQINEDGSRVFTDPQGVVTRVDAQGWVSKPPSGPVRPD